MQTHRKLAGAIHFLFEYQLKTDFRFDVIDFNDSGTGAARAYSTGSEQEQTDRRLTCQIKQ